MECFEDDFGDLYADVEVQASSAINGVQDFARFYAEPEEGNNDNNDNSNNYNNKMNAMLGSEDGFDSGPNKPDSFGKEEAIVDTDGSDSEDDLNIVLNDEDCNSKKFPVASRESAKSDEDCKNEEDEDGLVASKEFKYVRSQGSAIPSGMKASGSNPILVRHDWNHSVRGQYKGPISGQVAVVGATPNFVMTHSRGFSLPWYRSIFDVNIDTFEEKPWRFSGVDMTDFFNFGFSEESWKRYCSSLGHFWQSALMQLGKPNHVPPGQAYEAGPKHDERVEETMVDNISQPKGRAIQVEDGIGERQPSVDVWRPRTQDSDVVIQITLEDSSDNGDKLDHIVNTVPETSYDREFNETDNTHFPHCNGDNGDEFSVRSLEERDNTVDSTRCSAKTTTYNPVTNDPDDTEKNQSPGIYGNHHKESHTLSPDGTVESFETVNETSEGVGFNACSEDQCTMEPELSLGEEGQLSLTSSCFESDSEASGDSNYLNPGKVTCSISRSSGNPGAELCKSLTYYQKNLKGNDAKIKPVDSRDYLKRKICVQEEQKHRLGRSDSGRWREKMEPVCFGSEEDLACYEDSKLSHCFAGRKFSKNNSHTVQKKYRKITEDFYEERDPYFRQSWKKRGYLCGDQKRDGFWWQRDSYNRDLNPLAYRESGHFGSRSKMKINRVHFRKSTNHDRQFHYHKLDSDFVQERYARPVSLVDQNSDILDEDYERLLPKCWKEMKKLGRNRHEDAFPLESEGLWSRKTKNESWRNTNVHNSRQSYRESDGGRWTDSVSPRNGSSHSRFLGNDRRQELESKENGWFDSCNNWDEFEHIYKFPDDQAHLRRKRRCGWKSDALQWTEEELTVGHQDEKLNTKKSSSFYKKDGRHGIHHTTRGSLHDAMYIDNMQSDHGYNMRRDGNNAQFIYGSRKTNRGKNEQTFRRCRDSVDLIVGKGKVKLGKLGLNPCTTVLVCMSAPFELSQTYTSFIKPTGFSLSCNPSWFELEITLSGSRQMDRNLSCIGGGLEGTDLDVGQEPNTLVDLKVSPIYKVIHSNLPKGGGKPDNEKFPSQFPAAVRNENLDIEDGQIITEEPYKHASAAHMHKGEKRKLRDDFASHGSMTSAEYDNQRILETIAKMEKRRERFKEPVSLKREQDKSQEPDIVPIIVDTPEIKQRRPTRKRQWCAEQAS
ncbi:Pre-mRNA polyadenylation factor Fip [Parasponia andersonii]|uniref:Pre-mRNA polyadenylation factor Fip n=1 Tax=Parasponia andersonii TaxID=3476 RepID=A0A2P5CV81_PARAD|nr:Pre-mRNA polyadenylation factor Fip [Parasponia andersonii]